MEAIIAQYDFGTINPATKSGTALAGDLNSDRDAMQSSHKGSAAPSYKKAGMIWLDDSANPIWTMKMWDGSDWIQLLVIDVTNNLCTADTDKIFDTLGPSLSITSAGSANTYTGSISPTPTAYTTGSFIFVTWNVKNTGTSTLNLNSLGAKGIKLPNGANVADGDLPLNGTSLLYYNGTNFILLSQAFIGVATQDLNMNGKAIHNGTLKLITAASVSSGTHNFDYSVGNYKKITATGDFTLGLTNLPSAGPFILFIEAVNWGAHNITLPTSIKASGGSAPSFTVSGTDMVSIYSNDAGERIIRIHDTDIQTVV